MQTQADLLIWMMHDNGLKYVEINSDIFNDVYDELECQGRKPRRDVEDWMLDAFHKLKDDDRFEVGKHPKDKRKVIYKLKENIHMPERDYVRNEDILYAMKRVEPNAGGWVKSDQLMKYFDCKIGSVRYRMIRMAQEGLLISKKGRNFGYKLP